jgi:hypothetical protein
LEETLKVLIACEFSGTVRRAFRERGHDAWSCDLLPAEDGSPFHIQGDFREAIKSAWDFIGFHPDCRVMANSGVRWLDTKPGRRDELKTAAELFRLCLNDPRPGYVENSVMHCHAKELIGREQTQTVQPWYFGEPFFKATCLWLRGGIPELTPTNKLTPPARGTEAHKAWSMVHRATPGADRWKKRSRTFPGFAQAMALQWG